MIVTRLEEAASHLVVPDLATLQRILDEICDGGGTLAQWMGDLQAVRSASSSIERD